MAASHYRTHKGEQTIFSDKSRAKQEVLGELWKKLCSAAKRLDTAYYFSNVHCAEL